MQNKQIQYPVSLKVSYLDELVLKLCVPHHFQINKFKRHWVVMGGFDLCKQQEIYRKLYAYLNQGDLIKFKGSKLKSNWREKVQQTHNLNEFFRRQQKKSQKNETIEIISRKNQSQENIIEWIIKIYQQDRKQQMEGLKILTIFLNFGFNNQIMSKILNLLQSENNPNILVNIFADDDLARYDSRYEFINKWVYFNSLSEVDCQLRYFFYKLGKTNVKRINLHINCQDGEIIRRKLSNTKKSVSEWSLQNNKLSFNIYFPLANKIYINTIQMRNLGYQQYYKFQLSLQYVDAHDTSFFFKKAFQLKPQRKEFENIKSFNHIEENRTQTFNVSKIDQSLRYDSYDFFDRISNLKHVCQKIQVKIRNNSNFIKSTNQDQDKLKTLHSFQI